MTEGQPVTVVGNLAEINKAESRAAGMAQDSYDSNAVDIAHAVGRPVDQDTSTAAAAAMNANAKISHNVPINHVSDYDVLDLDLAGLKQISKTGLAAGENPWQTNAPPAGNFPFQITQGNSTSITFIIMSEIIIY